MKRIFLPTLMAVMIGTNCYAADPAKPANDSKMQEMMTKMKNYGTPGPAHKVLADMAGDWTYTSKFWSSAEGKPEETKGTSKMKMVLGGRWLQNETKGMAMGQPFEGFGLMGYDNVKKSYESLWFDTMSTGVMRGTGTFDATAKVLKDSGQYSCPITEKDRSYRSEWKIVDKNNMVYTMYGTGMDGSTAEFKQMEMTLKRSK